MPGILAGADVAVFPSLMEATSVAALEAMSCGLPVAASRVGGLPEIVDESVGVLFEPADPAALADALAALLERPDLDGRPAGSVPRRGQLERGAACASSRGDLRDAAPGEAVMARKQERPVTKARVAPVAAPDLPVWVAPVAYAVVTVLLFREFFLAGVSMLGTDSLVLSYFARNFYTEFVQPRTGCRTGTRSSSAACPSWKGCTATSSIRHPSRCSPSTPVPCGAGRWRSMSSSRGSSRTSGCGRGWVSSASPPSSAASST
jgi:hypothetical protein